MVFCNIRVWHRVLLAKLYHYGITGNLHSLFVSYFIKQVFKELLFQVGISDWVEILAGVAQGSILGTLLFLLFINDIVREINSNIRLFADNTTIYIIVDFPDSAAQILNIDLERIAHWAAMWLVNFNPNKNEAKLNSRKYII